MTTRAFYDIIRNKNLLYYGKYSIAERFFELKMAAEHLNLIECPMIPLRGAVAFPGIPISLELERKMSVSAFEEAEKSGLPIFLLTQKNPIEASPKSNEFYGIGTVCRIKQFVRLSNGNVRIIADGETRGEVVALFEPKVKGRAWVARVTPRNTFGNDDASTKAALVEAKDALAEYAGSIPEIANELLAEADNIGDSGRFADFVAANLFGTIQEKMRILKEIDAFDRLVELSVILSEQAELAGLQREVHKKVKKRVDRNQKEYYISEQIKVLKAELGEDAEDSEIEKYKEAISKSAMPKEAKEKLTKEAGKLSRMPFNSAEYGVICNYLDVCLELPWGDKTEDRLDIALAREILERDHDGLEKVKERIIEYLAVKKLAPDVKNQILCLVGPPGTGKTSIVRSIAEAMNRNYVRVSLGGVRDEADIRGHRKTYIASMPGRIINGIKRAKSKNPVMLLDEIDKLTRDSHGDPASALMEVLDAEQNKEFRDHFVEMPFDLSDVMFIATANTLDTIPAPLLDRMEVIELKSYSLNEKLSIAKKYLIPKQCERHGLTKKTFKISDPALKELIECYTREAGVRKLEREIASVCRKAARMLIEEESVKSVSVTGKNLAELIGGRKLIPEKVSEKNEVGVVNGLAYTELGGTLLKVETAALSGSGKIELTGSLGDVMKESAKAAVTYIRANAEKLGIEEDFYSKKDIHIHFPEGAIPKDGPSAGVTMVTALVSELSGKPVRSSVAMTGEVTLKGKVLAIGGLKEKTMAAYKSGVKTVLIPKDNMKDLDEIDKTVREGLEFIPCETVSEVLHHAVVGC